jgi:hypothetical protein
MQKKSITNDYNSKVDNIVSQVNDSQKTVYDYTHHRDKVIQNNTQLINKVSSNVENLQKQSEINNNDIITLDLQQRKYAVDNNSNIQNFQWKISQMPWDQQLLNTSNLQVTQEQQQLVINSLKYTDAEQTKTNLGLNVNINNNSNNYSILSNVVNSNSRYVSDNIKNNITNFYALSSYTSNAFYGIQGNYINNSNQVAQKIIKLDENTKFIKDTYTPKSDLTTEINTIDTTYNTYSNFSYTKINNLDTRLSNVQNTYVNHSELTNAILVQSTNIQGSFAKSLASNLTILHSNIAIINQEYTSLPITYVSSNNLVNEKNIIQQQINTINFRTTNMGSNENNSTIFSNVSVKDFNASGVTTLPINTKIAGQDAATQPWVQNQFTGQSVTREWILKYWPQGPVGLNGPVGPAGPVGSIGPGGPVGPQGQKGETGNRGPEGLRGQEGARGPQGLQGPEGARGPQGVSGFGTDTINNVKFSQGWTGFPDNATDKSEISNDITNPYGKQLMIAGNKSAGGPRKVGIWDELNMNGQLNVNGDFRICDSSGNCVNLLDEVKWN